MAYSVLEYIKLNDQALLLQRFNNTEHLAKIIIDRRNQIQQAMEDREYALAEIARYNSWINDYKEDMENIAIAMEALRAIP